MAPIQNLGILTSGGDCAGLNAAIRAVAERALAQGWRLHGIAGGTLGLIERPLRVRELDAAALAQLPFRSGGTVLGTVNRGDPFASADAGGSPDRAARFAAGARELGLDALVVIGGDGSMRILHRLCSEAGLPMVGIPKTIDNDVPGTDLAIGFSTAVQVVSDAIDRLQPTAASHHRVMVVEVMGREAGHIALHGGIAGGADVILLPELPLHPQQVYDRVRRLVEGGQGYALVVIAEGVGLGPGGGGGTWLASEIRRHAGVEARCTVLGHLQRGGPPTAEDRLLAAVFGSHAVDLLVAGQAGRMVAWRQGSVTSVPITEVIGGPCHVRLDDPLLLTARKIGIGLADRRD